MPWAFVLVVPSHYQLTFEHIQAKIKALQLNFPSSASQVSTHLNWIKSIHTKSIVGDWSGQHYCANHYWASHLLCKPLLHREVPSIHRLVKSSSVLKALGDIDCKRPSNAKSRITSGARWVQVQFSTFRLSFAEWSALGRL